MQIPVFICLAGWKPKVISPREMRNGGAFSHRTGANLTCRLVSVSKGEKNCIIISQVENANSAASKQKSLNKF